MKTLADAIKAGYSIADSKYQRGYVSRKVDQFEQPLQVAGGSRKGQLYVLLPAYNTTNYCRRVYLVK